MWSYFVFIFCNLLPIVITENVGSFNRSHVGVFFDPFVSIEESEVVYGINGLIPMISKISTEFNKIMTGIVGEQTDSTTPLIPSAVATFNKEHFLPNETKLEVLLTFGMSVIQKPSNGTKFEVAKKIADEANRIFPGTVKTLYLDYSRLYHDTIEETKNYLKYVRGLLLNTSYSLGAIFPTEDCEDEKKSGKFPSYLAQVLPFFRYIIFETEPKAEQAITEITGKFKECLQRFGSYKEISVGFRTSWVQWTPGVTQDEKLVQYWEAISKWVVEFNTSVVFETAFDTPHEENIYKYRGWWRLIENSSYYESDPSLFLFEEKREAIKRLKQGMKKEHKSTSSTTIWFFVVGIILLIFLVALGVLVYFRGRQGNNFLKKSELETFYNGISSEIGEEGYNSEIQKTAFNKELELSKSNFKLEPQNLLGSGAFGVVCRGYVQNVNEEAEIQVAVKTTNPSSPSSALAGILSEIKVMNYLGKHENIVNIVGAYTKGIQKGKIYLFLELCTLGSLEKYLRKNISGLESQLGTQNDSRMTVANFYKNISNKRENCQAEVVNTANNYSNELMCIVSENGDLKRDNLGSTADLCRWSCEIASGMEFLASKNVVHADLATRNVLLTVDKRAKISDFGLSRRLYDYSMYVKKQQEPLPWRWMAPESLRRMEFDEKTDVWAFGVTLWEIYSLGDIPFEGLSWTPNFSSQLSQGLRLPEPRYCVNGMYSIMLKCWNVDPAGRPFFSDLKSRLQPML